MPSPRLLPKELTAGTAVLDGEIVCLDNQGRSQFNELLFGRGEPRFYAFDLLWCEGKDVRYDGLHERKRQLKALISQQAMAPLLRSRGRTRRTAL